MNGPQQGTAGPGNSAWGTPKAQTRRIHDRDVRSNTPHPHELGRICSSQGPVGYFSIHLGNACCASAAEACCAVHASCAAKTVRARASLSWCGGCAAFEAALYCQQNRGVWKTLGALHGTRQQIDESPSRRSNTCTMLFKCIRRHWALLELPLLPAP